MSTQGRKESVSRTRGEQIRQKEETKQHEQTRQQAEERPHDYFPDAPSASDFKDAEFTSGTGVPENAMDGVREATAHHEKGLEPSAEPAAILRAPTVESALDVIEQLLDLVAHRTATTVDDFLLRHITALKNSPELVKELQNDLDLMFGYGGKPAPSMSPRQRLGLLTRVVSILGQLGGNLDLGLILELMTLASALVQGELSLGEILESLRRLLDRSRALREGHATEGHTTGRYPQG